jgi:hypothetical protein
MSTSPDRTQNNLLCLGMRSQCIEIHRSGPLVWDQHRTYNSETMFASIVDLFAQIPCTVRRPKEQFRRPALEPKSRIGNRTRCGILIQERGGRKQQLDFHRFVAMRMSNLRVCQSGEALQSGRGLAAVSMSMTIQPLHVMHRMVPPSAFKAVAAIGPSSARPVQSSMVLMREMA